MVELVLAFAVFALIVVGMVSLRLRVGVRFEVKNSDILIALNPIAFWLILSGKMKVVEFAVFSSCTPVKILVTHHMGSRYF